MSEMIRKFQHGIAVAELTPLTEIVDDGQIVVTPNLATPDNSHNCAEPNASEIQLATPPEAPKLPLAFTVITGIQPSRLTKLIGLDAKGGMRKETSAMLSEGQAQRVVVADLHGLKTHLDALTSAQAVTWGVAKDDLVAVCTQGDAEAQQAGSIARTRDVYRTTVSCVDSIALSKRTP